MKKTPHALTRLFTLLLASLTILSISVAAAGTAGSSSDPLVTLSYLNEKFLPELMTRVDEKLAARQRKKLRLTGFILEDPDVIEQMCADPEIMDQVLEDISEEQE